MLNLKMELFWHNIILKIIICYCNNNNFTLDTIFRCYVYRSRYCMPIGCCASGYIVRESCICSADKTLHAFNNLTHIRLASHFWDIGKRCRPRSDASDQGLHCLIK